MSNQKKVVVRLGRQEMQIMNVVWKLENATVRQVKDELGKGQKQKPVYSTILTMMRILEEKGYLEHDVDNRTYVYRPVIKQEAARQSILGDIVERLFEGSPSLVMNSLVGRGKISQKEFAKIKRIIEEATKDG